jgi:hypothetical protein
VLGDFVGNAVRSTLKLLGGAEHEVEKHSPVEEPLHEAVAALHHAAESMDRHVEVLEAVAATLPAMTEALVALTEQLGEFLQLAAPLEAAEREVAGLGHLFRRRRPPAALPAVAAAGPAGAQHAGPAAAPLDVVEAEPPEASPAASSSPAAAHDSPAA